MLEHGLLAETRALLEAGKLTGTAAQAIGYKELLDHFRGTMSLEQAADLIRQKSRNYAKRQLSWFGGDSRVHWIVYNKPEAGDDVFREATDFLHKSGLQF
jgi:tRNA dimethylallyltransferase